MKTANQIQAEADTLELMKPKVRKFSGFGDNHHNAIDAQIAVLRDDLSEDQIYDSYGDNTADEFEQNVLDEALFARQWMDGEEENAPSVEWKDLVI